jgi:multicomponent Na+:H+ antiporter subunit C
MSELFQMTGGLLFVIGLYGLFLRRRLVARLLCANIASTGAFLAVIAASSAEDPAADPVAQALVLTGIVIAVSVTAFALGLGATLSRPRRR